MKKCPYCAEEIQDEAIVCRFCGHGVPIGVGEMYERGNRFGLGTTDTFDAYGVWNLRDGGPVLATYPISQQGWTNAWDRFQSLERPRAGTYVALQGPGRPNVGGAVIVLLGGALIAVGSFLPWFTISAPLLGTISRSGMEGGDGIATLALGVVTIAIGVARLASSSMPALFQRSPIVTGLVAGIIGGIDLADILKRVEDVEAAAEGFGTASVGAGLWAVLVGAALAVLAGFTIRKPQAD